MITCLGVLLTTDVARGAGMTAAHIARLHSVIDAEISPDGQHIAYLLRVQRIPGQDEDGPAWSQLHVIDVDGAARPFVGGHVNLSHIAWTPDGRGISFVAKLGEAKKKGLYVIPVDGGEARLVVSHETDVGRYAWRPDGERVAFLATAKPGKEADTLREKGFKQEIYEEDYRPVQVWIAKPRPAEVNAPEPEAPRRLDLDGSAVDLAWSPAGGRLAVKLAPTPLIDDELMFSRIHFIEPEGGNVAGQVETEGKLGHFAFSPTGEQFAFLGAAHINDPDAGRLFVVSSTGGAPRELLPEYPGSVQALAWRDPANVLYIGHEGLEAVFGRVNVDGQERRTIVEAGGPILRSFSVRQDGQAAAFVADAPAHPEEVYHMQHGDQTPRRLTNSNPWLENVELAPQEAVRFTARDGLALEGVLMSPVRVAPEQRLSLVLIAHGGPEAHFSNGWLTTYNRPGQALAARGFAVFYPNYRGSTGRGVEFSMRGQRDYAGAEFDDLVDAKDYLVETGLVDPDKSGITGGSYGGYASAWAATKQTEHWAAAVMFVGVSEMISKFGTTDIPQEMYLVHARVWPWEDWDFFDRTSPVRYIEQARTPLLILHGANDTRVHPAQSITLYRYMKSYGKAPVRLVLYPGEGHGNVRAAARYDYCLRLMRWMEHYLQGAGGSPPPLELDYRLDAFEEGAHPTPRGEEVEEPEAQDPDTPDPAGPTPRVRPPA